MGVANTSTLFTGPRQLSDGNPVGTVLGISAADPISFYGVSPIVQQAAATLTASTMQASSVAASTSNTPFGFSSASQANAVLSGINQLVVDTANIRAMLVSTGLYR